MRALGLITAMAAMLVMIPAVPSVAPVQAVDVLAPQGCGLNGMVRLAQYGYPPDDPGDLATCQQTCRSRFGVDPYSDTDAEPQWFRGGGSGTYYAYAQCIADCNTAFWKDFDRKARDLERSR